MVENEIIKFPEHSLFCSVCPIALPQLRLNNLPSVKMFPMKSQNRKEDPLKFLDVRYVLSIY